MAVETVRRQGSRAHVIGPKAVDWNGGPRGNDSEFAAEVDRNREGEGFTGDLYPEEAELVFEVACGVFRAGITGDAGSVAG